MFLCLLGSIVQFVVDVVVCMLCFCSVLVRFLFFVFSLVKVLKCLGVKVCEILDIGSKSL